MKAQPRSTHDVPARIAPSTSDRWTISGGVEVTFTSYYPLDLALGGRVACRNIYTAKSAAIAPWTADCATAPRTRRL